MKSSARVVVVGGGVVGASVLYHLTKAGWSDVLLIERDELTSGSTWHAAGGMHTVNGDPNVAKLQQYTINLYKELERQGMPAEKFANVHAPVGLEIGAVTPEEIAVAIVAEMVAERRRAMPNVASKTYKPATTREEQDAVQEETAREP